MALNIVQDNIDNYLASRISQLTALLSADLNMFKCYIYEQDSHPKFYHVTRVPYL